MSDDTTFNSRNEDAAGRSADSRDKVRRVAKYQRVVIFAIMANLVVNIVSLSARELPPLAALGLLFLILCVVAIAIAAVFLLSRELYSVGIAVLCAALMIVPCVSLITLLIVNQSATSFLQRNGVKVGFLGTDPNRIP
jgi:hypothetical protein